MKNHSRPWTEDDKKQLAEYLNKGMSSAQVASILGRSIPAVQQMKCSMKFGGALTTNKRFAHSKSYVPNENTPDAIVRRRELINSVSASSFVNAAEMDDIVVEALKEIETAEQTSPDVPKKQLDYIEMINALGLLNRPSSITISADGIKIDIL